VPGARIQSAPGWAPSWASRCSNRGFLVCVSLSGAENLEPGRNQAESCRRFSSWGDFRVKYALVEDLRARRAKLFQLIKTGCALSNVSEDRCRLIISETGRQRSETIGSGASDAFGIGKVASTTVSNAAVSSVSQSIVRRPFPLVKPRPPEQNPTIHLLCRSKSSAPCGRQSE
jgi:hypothetical protein